MLKELIAVIYIEKLCLRLLFCRGYKENSLQHPDNRCPYS